MNYLMVVLWLNSMGQQVTISEFGSAQTCYDAKSVVESNMKQMSDKQFKIICVKR
jgi:hypothetical protein